MPQKKYRILNTQLSIPSHDFFSYFQRIRNNISAKTRLLEQIILYDRVFIATKNFLIVPLLVEWAGINNLLQLLRKNVIGFTRPRSFIGYDGKHQSIELLELFWPGKTLLFEEDWIKIADSANIKEASFAVIKKTLKNHRESDLHELYSLVMRNTKQVEFKSVAANISEETRKDFLDGEIRKKLLIKAPDLSSAADIGEDQIKIGFDNDIFDPTKSREIDKALAIGFSNFDFFLGGAIPDADIYTDNISKVILEAKLRRNLKPHLISEGLSDLLSNREIPDFTQLVESGKLSFNNVFDVLGLTDTLKFRNWLHSLEISSSSEVLKDYVNKLENHYNEKKIGQKIVRFLLTVTLGLINQPTGLIGSFVDSFIVDELLKKWHPKLFLDKFRSTFE